MLPAQVPLMLLCFVCLALGAASPAPPAKEQNYFVPMPLDYTKTVPLEMVYVAPGTFTRGARPGQPRCMISARPCQVTISEPFWIGKYEITQAQWQAVMGYDQHHYYKQTFRTRGIEQKQKEIFVPAKDPKLTGDNLPMFSINWEDAMEFCRKLTVQEQRAGRLPQDWRYMLPYDVQWEFAARGGIHTRDYLYAGGNQPEAVANLHRRGVSSRHLPVGSLQPNELGLYDMSGNVCEMTLDTVWKSPLNYDGDNLNPAGDASGIAFNNRGGGYNTNQEHHARLYASGMILYSAFSRGTELGFRIVCCRQWPNDPPARPRPSPLESDLLKACRERNFPELKRLVKLNVNCNVREQYHFGYTPLLTLTTGENPAPEMVEFLLQHGADPNLCTSNGFPPLYFPARCDLRETVRVLLKYGAKPDYAPSGYTPLSTAVDFRRKDIVKMLLAYGADPEPILKQQSRIDPEILTLLKAAPEKPSSSH